MNIVILFDDKVDDEKLHVAATHSGDWVLASVLV